MGHFNNQFDKNIRSLGEVISGARSQSRHFYRKWKDLEEEIVGSGRANSLPLYLLEQHWVNGKSTGEIAKELGITNSANMFNAFNIPLRFKRKDEKVYKSLALDYVSSNLSFAELSEKYKIGSVQKALDKAVRNQWITQEQRDIASTKRKKTALDKTRDNRGILSDEELKNLANDYINSDTPRPDLEKKYGIKCVWNMVRRAVRRNLVNEEEWSEAAKRRKQHTLTQNRKKADGQVFSKDRREKMSVISRGESNPFYGKSHTDATKKAIAKKNSKYSLEDITALALDYIYFDDSYDKLREHYRVKDLGHLMRRAMTHGVITKKQYSEAFARRMAKRYAEDPRFQEIARQSGIRLANTDRERTCVLNGTKYDSKGEAAVGELLKKYVPNFDLIKGKTFQANGDVNCVFDFVLPQAIVEWHPTNWLYDVSEQDKQAYKELRANATEEEREILRQVLGDHKADLGVNYWMSRQEASDNSQIYQGKEVILARDFNEFYADVLSRYGANLPSIKDLRKEFNSHRKKAELVKPKKEAAA